MTFMGNYGLPDQVLIEKKILTDPESVFNDFYEYGLLVYFMKGREEGVLVHIFVSLTVPLFKWATQSKLCDIYFK